MDSEEKFAHSAETLSEELRGMHGFSSVGIASGPVLVVYFSRIMNGIRAKIPSQWDSLPVKVEEIGTMRPLRR